MIAGPHGPRRPADGTADHEDAQFVKAHIVTQQAGADLVLADGDRHAAEFRFDQNMQQDIDGNQDGHEILEHLGRLHFLIRLPGQGHDGNGRDAVESTQTRRADDIFRAGGMVDQLIQDQGHHQGDHAQIDIVQAAIEHEITKGAGEQHAERDGDQKGYGGLAHVDGGNGKDITAQAEKTRLTETQDTAEAPDVG